MDWCYSAKTETQHRVGQCIYVFYRSMTIALWHSFQINIHNNNILFILHSPSCCLSWSLSCQVSVRHHSRLTDCEDSVTSLICWERSLFLTKQLVWFRTFLMRLVCIIYPTWSPCLNDYAFWTYRTRYKSGGKRRRTGLCLASRCAGNPSCRPQMQQSSPQPLSSTTP